MQRITIKQALPKVFAERKDIISEVWLSDLSFEKGNRYLVSAESGSGKSSLCSFIYGVRTDYEGKIFFDEKDSSTLSVNEWCKIRKQSIAYLPQDLKLFAELSSLENVMLKNKLTGFKEEKEIINLFELLGIGDKVNSPLGKLSIGQQQRVAIIRTICQPCDFFLLDEPVSHLDEGNNAIISKLLMDEAAKQGAGIISTSVGNNILIETDKNFKL